MKEYPVIDVEETGGRIKMLRKSKHYTVTQVATYMGFQRPQAVYKWERGETLPSIDNLYALSLLFEVPMEHMIVERKLKSIEGGSSLDGQMFAA